MTCNVILTNNTVAARDIPAIVFHLSPLQREQWMRKHSIAVVLPHHG